MCDIAIDAIDHADEKILKEPVAQCCGMYTYMNFQRWKR